MMKRFLLVLSVICLGTWLIYLYLGCPDLGIDDAHIFFVYGQNLAGGEGLVYNPGGERVEGYSSPLWVLMIAAVFLVSPFPEWSLLGVNLLIASGVIVALWRFVDHAINRTWGLLVMAWVFSSPAFIFWMGLPLMETALWTGCLVLGTLAALSPQSTRYLAVMIVLTLLTRPEGMLWGVVLIGVRGVVVISQNDLKTTGQYLTLPIIAYCLTLGSLLIFRLFYFGYPLPNTYYAKLSPDILYNLGSGTEYLLLFGYLYPLVWVSIIATVTIFLLNIPRLVMSLQSSSTKLDTETTLHLAISIVILAGLLAPVWMGGDNFFLFRLYQPIWPLLPLPIYGVLRILPVQLKPLPRYALLAGAAVIFFVTPWAKWFPHDHSYGPGFVIAMEGEAVGNALNVMFEEELPLVGVVTAGGIAVAYEGIIFDMMGLNHVAMAHAPGKRYGIKGHAAFDETVFFKERPHLVLPVLEPSNDLEIRWEERYKWDNRALKGLLTEKEFLQNYRLVLLTKFDKHILTYVEKSYVDSLRERGFSIRFIENDPLLPENNFSENEAHSK